MACSWSDATRTPTRRGPDGRAFMTEPPQGPRLACPLRASIGSTEAPLREVTVDGDHRSDGRFLEASASLQAERALLCKRAQGALGFFARWVSQMPCANVPGRYAEPSNFQIGMAHPWSWAIGSSTSAAQRSFDMVVSCRKARPFVLSTKLGLQENGRPSLKGMAPWPGPCSMG